MITNLVEATAWAVFLALIGAPVWAAVATGAVVYYVLASDYSSRSRAKALARLIGGRR